MASKYNAELRESMLQKQRLQIVLFSATFPDKVVKYAEIFAPEANQITLRHEELTVEGIKQLYMDCASEGDKYDVLVKLYGLMTIGSSIIFVKVHVITAAQLESGSNYGQRRDTAVEIERRMVREGHKVASLTGAFEGGARDAIIDAFREGRAKVLITTNVLARGIDVQTVSMVINYVSTHRYISRYICMTNRIYRMSQTMATATPTHKHIFTGLAAPDASDELAFQSPLSTTRRVGRCSWRSLGFTVSRCSGWKLTTGISLRKPSRRSSRAQLRTRTINHRRQPRLPCELLVIPWTRLDETNGPGLI